MINNVRQAALSQLELDALKIRQKLIMAGLGESKICQKLGESLKASPLLVYSAGKEEEGATLTHNLRCQMYDAEVLLRRYTKIKNNAQIERAGF